MKKPRTSKVVEPKDCDRCLFAKAVVLIDGVPFCQKCAQDRRLTIKFIDDELYDLDDED